MIGAFANLPVDDEPLPQMPVAEIMVRRPVGHAKAPLAHVQFCFACELFCVPRGVMEVCPDCHRAYPRE